MAPSVLLLAFLALAGCARSHRVVCYWNGQSFWRPGIGRVTTAEIKPALAYCTHLIYGFAAIDDDDFHLEPIDKILDKDTGITNLQPRKGQYRAVSALKRSFPDLKILLSVGGNEDKVEPEKYLEVLERRYRRIWFAKTAARLLKRYDFDGLDLAWQFPPQHEKYEKRSLASIWHKMKKMVGIGVDWWAAAHKRQFVSLVQEVRAELDLVGRTLTLGVLPHVNASVYFDVKALMPYVEFVNLWTFDMRTPERTPQKADFSAPLQKMLNRKPFQNAEWVINHWLLNGADSYKLVLGIPTFGRTWTMNFDSPASGIPPLAVDGPGERSYFTNAEGLLAYYEICGLLESPSNPDAAEEHLRRAVESNMMHGTYAYRVASRTQSGLWVSFEEPDTAAFKAVYSNIMNLGGVALIDIGLDDSTGNCNGFKFPILRAAKHNMDLSIIFPHGGILNYTTVSV